MLKAVTSMKPNNAAKMKQAVGKYVVSFQAERFHNEKRYHWMVCCAPDPGELVSWGHALTQELAEKAASNEVKDLSSGKTQGGHVVTATNWRLTTAARHSRGGKLAGINTLAPVHRTPKKWSLPVARLLNTES